MKSKSGGSSPVSLSSVSLPWLFFALGSELSASLLARYAGTPDQLAESGHGSRYCWPLWFYSLQGISTYQSRRNTKFKAAFLRLVYILCMHVWFKFSNKNVFLHHVYLVSWWFSYLCRLSLMCWSLLPSRIYLTGNDATPIMFLTVHKVS